MKCPEAVEWMHRYIDHDLNEEESSVLFEHMQNCPECSEKFAILNELSAKLEELPKVTPRFSLVDSILPQLDVIDRARREEGSAAEDVAGTMVAAESTDELSRSRRERPVRRSSRAYRTGAFGLAAAVILGVFIYQYEPKTMPDAEIASRVAFDSNSSTADRSSSSETEESADNFSKQDGGETGPIMQEDHNTPAADESLKSSGNGAGGESKSDSSNGGSGGSQETTTPDRSGNDAAPPKAANPAANGGNSGTSSPATLDRDKNAKTPQESAPLNNEGGAEAEDSDASLKTMVPEKAPVDGLADSSMMGIANFLATNQWPSPDGKYTAELRDNHLYVYRNDAEDRTLLVDQTLDGNWVNGEWSQDGKTFTYETEKDGTSAAHTVQPVQSETGADGNSSANQP
ncbi:putative zinc finger protein [Fontibacillus phaseoli]|uniref:Anti-sigma-W factor RsiW n=1 Tax=Fontibacillus phaseoli TaxID=1416533 RepID=A0A369BM96_9BACL|nr:anti-sigma factor [Fontibacillus phaseoli]RCX22729.1 putative zinc finger protein [Fontibacillus phaseoli]